MKGTAIGIVVTIILICVVWSFQPYHYENIDVGNVGIKINLYGTDRGVDNNYKIVTGREWYNSYTTKIIQFNTSVQNVDYMPFDIYTVDGTKFKIDTRMQYYVVKDSVPSIYQTFRNTLPELQGEGRFIQTSVYEAFKNSVPAFTSDSLVAKRADFEKKVEILLKSYLMKKGIVLYQLTSNIIPPESMQKAIEAKNASIQARYKAENLAKQATAEATVIVAKAKGAAEATLIKARAEAEANKLKQQTLTPLLIQQEWIQRWNGQLPTTQAGAGSSFMLGLK